MVWKIGITSQKAQYEYSKITVYQLHRQKYKPVTELHKLKKQPPSSPPHQKKET